MTYAETDDDNAVYGNRNYLMFIQQYHEVFKNALENSSGSPASELDHIRNAILGLQCGDLKASERLVERLQNSTSPIKDHMWVHFRSCAQRILINLALKAKEDGSLDSFETFYSDFIDQSQLD